MPGACNESGAHWSSCTVAKELGDQPHTRRVSIRSGTDDVLSIIRGLFAYSSSTIVPLCKEQKTRENSALLFNDISSSADLTMAARLFCSTRYRGQEFRTATHDGLAGRRQEVSGWGICRYRHLSQCTSSCLVPQSCLSADCATFGRYGGQLSATRLSHVQQSDEVPFPQVP